MLKAISNVAMTVPIWAAELRCQPVGLRIFHVLEATCGQSYFRNDGTSVRSTVGSNYLEIAAPAPFPLLLGSTAAPASLHICSMGTHSSMRTNIVA